MTEKKTVVVGMSGGVDSSLTAALLLEQGYDVIGVTMRLADESRDFAENDHGCCSLSAVDDARRVCDILGIPHYVMDFKDLFREKVIDNFLTEYAHGRTPNPCIDCNRYVKFGGLLERAFELGANYVATGHYARIEQNAAGRWLLKKGVDTQKDQAYALYHLDQHSLAHFLMPLGAGGDLSSAVSGVLMIGAAIAATYLFENIFQIFSTRLANKIGLKFSCQLRSTVYDKVQRMSVSSLSKILGIIFEL